MTKVFITPTFTGDDNGEGGIRRVVEAQRKWLPTVGVEVVDTIDECDVIAAHAVEWPRTDKPVVSHNHGLYWGEYEWPQWALHANERVLESMLRADAVTVVSEWVARAVERNTWIKPTVVYHGIDPDEWPKHTRTKGTPNYVLWNKTRIDPICDPAAMQELAARCADVQFVTTFGNATKNVRISGKVPYEQAKAVVRNAAVYLATSRETLGIGTLEAMAAGVPVLGWAWGGQCEIIEHGVDGWLAPPGDYASLEEGLRACLANRAKWGAAARTKVFDRFRWANVIRGYVDVYEAAIAAHKAEAVRVSVVIPCYNLGGMLTDAVASAVAGPRPVGGVEVIIVDDASTDDSGSVADRLAEQYNTVRVIHNERNQYLAGALNVGIAAARGKYIVPLDADNMLAVGAVATLAAALDADAGIDIAYGGMAVIEADGQEWTSPWPTDFSYAQQMAHHNQIPSTSMYRRKVWERVGGYRRRCRTAEDADFWCRVTSYGAVARKVTGDVVLRYRNREDSMSHTEADWPWHKWYPWWRDPRTAPPISPMKGPIWSYEPVKISVVIPVGPGHTRLVVDALDSLAAQSFRWWEAIVVNDSGEDIPWVHAACRVLPSGVGANYRTLGPAVARNVGIKAAKGSLVVFLDADDFLQPDALESFWNEWVSYGKAAAHTYIYSDWVIQETGEIKVAEEYDCTGLLAKLPHAVTAAYPLAAVRAVGGFDETMKAWEDWDFVLSLAAAGNCGARLAMPLIHYRMKAGTRREDMYARRGELIEHIRDKWRDYYSGAKQMACGSCGQRARTQTAMGTMAARNGSTPMSPATAAREDAVLIEYTGRASGPMVYRGPVTGTPYRFGLDAHHKLRYVLAADAPALLVRSDFRVGHAQAELLQAAGV